MVAPWEARLAGGVVVNCAIKKRPRRAFGKRPQAPRKPSARAGIPGVAGRLGVPAEQLFFWKRAVFFSFFPRVSDTPGRRTLVSP